MSGQVRIIAGRWRGRSLRFPAVPGLRPTPNRVRETLFNWLGQSLPEYECLDLFAGSGALGFEALSRGARQVIWVELERNAAASLRANAARLGVDGAAGKVVCADAVLWLKVCTQSFDLVFLDPPFASAFLIKDCLGLLASRLNSGGMVYCESPSGVSEWSGWRVLRQSRAGQVCSSLLCRADIA